MFSKFKFSFLPVLLAFLSACGGGTAPGKTQQQADVMAVTAERPYEDQASRLDEIAALERAGSWFQGMGMAESGLRESSGDYAGAVAAAYKEMSWAYGKGLIKKEDLERGLAV
ncbi:hypothetical protein, partial [Treponema sp. R6D11]